MTAHRQLQNSITRSSAFCLEYFDFRKPLRSQLVQKRQAVFIAENDNIAVNSLSFFIWIGFPDCDGNSKKTIRAIRRPLHPKTAFPYGVPDLIAPNAVSGAVANSVSSCNEDKAMTSSWRNLVVWLPTHVQLTTGQMLCVDSDVNATHKTQTPVYHLRVRVLEKINEDVNVLQDMHVTLDQLYPVYDYVAPVERKDTMKRWWKGKDNAPRQRLSK